MKTWIVSSLGCGNYSRKYDMNFIFKKFSLFVRAVLRRKKKVNDLGEMQAYQLATGGTAISWDWRGSNNNFVLKKRSPLMPAPIRVDINYFFSFHLFSGFFHPCSLLPCRPTPFNQLCARHWSPSPFWRRFTVNLPEDQLWTRIHWGNWNFSLQSLDFWIAFARKARVGKVQIFWEGHKNLKKFPT